MAYKDLRHWLAEVERDGELKQISGASWDLEMSGISEIIHRVGKRPIPALMFDDIPGYPKGYRVLFGMLSSLGRITKALYLPCPNEDIDPLAVVRGWHIKEREIRLIPPKTITTGSVQENYLDGDKADVSIFPSPRCHELDGGRYIGTANAVIQKDPDTGWVNLGIYRCMLVDHNRIALHMLEGQHGRVIYDKYLAQKKVMPVAIAIGIDPTLWFAAGQRIPWGVSEYDYAGAIRGEAIEVIEGPHTKLPIPASAEIVIEGDCIPNDLIEEGPFGEWHGYYANQGLEPVLEPLIRVKSVLYRDNPILTSLSPSVPPGEISLSRSIGLAATVWTTLEKSGIPGIIGVWAPESGGSRLFVVVSIKQLYAGHSMDVGLISAQCVGNLGRYVVVVDEDIDPSDLNQVMWAIATRTKPEQSIQILRHCGASSADPAIPVAAKREHKILFGSRAIIDACQPFESKGEWYPISRASSELEGRILKNWAPVFKELC
ncbi:UbiD family decarboxylase [Bacteroidota bacterium]